MQTQKTGLDFKGQNIFVGIDVHLKSWAVTILKIDKTIISHQLLNFLIGINFAFG
jgi:hypothetical protein